MAIKPNELMQPTEEDKAKMAKIEMVIDTALKNIYEPGGNAMIAVSKVEEESTEKLTPRLRRILVDTYSTAGWNVTIESGAKNAEFLNFSEKSAKKDDPIIEAMPSKGDWDTKLKKLESDLNRKPSRNSVDNPYRK